MHFSSASLAIVITALGSGANAFGVNSQINRNVAFASPRVESTKLEAERKPGALVTEPNETTGIKALGALGAAGALLGAALFSPLTSGDIPALPAISLPGAPEKTVQVAKPSATTTKATPAPKPAKKVVTKSVKEQGYDFEAEETTPKAKKVARAAKKAEAAKEKAAVDEAKAGEAAADKAAAEEAAKKAAAEKAAAERTAKEKEAADKAAEKDAKKKEAEAKKAADKAAKEEAAAKKASADQAAKEKAQADAAKAAEAKADAAAAEAKAKKAAEEKVAAERAAREKEAADAAAEKAAREKEAAAKAAADKAAKDEAAAAKAVAEEKALGVVSGSESGGKVLPAETVSDDVKAFLKKYN